MSRLDPLPLNATAAEQRELWESLVGSRRASETLVDAQGSLRGPFQAMVMSPAIGAPLAQVGAAIRFASSLEPRLLEIAICTVGARWQSNFEFWAHRRLAEKAGVSGQVLDDLAAGTDPTFAHTDEEIVWRFARDLCTDGHVSDAVYDDAKVLLGEDALVQLIHTIGYYCHISLILNATRATLPPGEEPVWPIP